MLHITLRAEEMKGEKIFLDDMDRKKFLGVNDFELKLQTQPHTFLKKFYFFSILISEFWLLHFLLDNSRNDAIIYGKNWVDLNRMDSVFSENTTL